MLFYVLACILIALALLIGLALLIAPALIPKHPPTHPRRTCCTWGCANRADVYDHERPWRSWCASCHVKHLIKKGEIL